MKMLSQASSRRTDTRGGWRGGGECTMVAASLVLPPPACTGSTECRHEGPADRGSSLLAKLMRLRMVALHSSSFSAAGGKSRSSCKRASASTGMGGSESCVDRDALRLLTTLEGALSRSCGRTPFPPASSVHAGPVHPESDAKGSSRGDARGHRHRSVACHARVTSLVMV